SWVGPPGRPGASAGRGRGRRGDRRRVQVIRHAEVVIIGGGVTGASIAFHLTAVGARDVLLLERKFLASGGTGRSVGIVRQLYPTPETSQMVVRSLAAFRASTTSSAASRAISAVVW